MGGHKEIEPMFKVEFEDNSGFSLPKDWEDVFVDYFGPNPEFYPAVAERLSAITGKYIKNRAWPSKFDGLQYTIAEEEGQTPAGDERFDDPEFYWEHWDDWGSDGIEWGIPRRKIFQLPKWADIAEAVLYQEMRGGLLQKALQQLGSKTKVITPKQLLKELKDQ